ncbi:MAG: adenylate/guanylate cyclase domain-containing protein [Afipia sp.]|nr:MAG: adenylate/guanylate cyclase domain-containing protein [Afipia sp.]
MAEAAASSTSRFIRGIGIRQVRLTTGIILFAYIVSHFANHALGNISLGAMDDALYYHAMLWQSWPVLVLLYGSVLIHLGLGLWALYARRHFRWTGIELTQLIFGLSIPAFIISHVIGVRLAAPLFGHEKDYPQVFFAYWVYRPQMQWMMYAVLLISWVHGCIGIYFWVRAKPYFEQISSLLLALAVLLPALSMLGLYQGARAVERASAAPEWRADNLSREKVGTAAEQASLERISSSVLYGYFGLIGLALLARGARALVERRRGLVRLSYGNGKTVRIPIGLSVLEASTRFNIPHSSACGGRARCSTCRIRIIGDYSHLPAPSNRETFVLDRVGTGSDPAIRLACQLRPRTDVTFFQIFPANTASSGSAIKPAHPGSERYVVSMFVDMRGSTKLAERHLPFDTVFIINRFLTAVSQAVVECGGQPNQFVGDGQLALFGLSTNPQTACRQAIEAASRIAVHIEALNAFLGDDIPEPIRFGIGIHGGEVIIGDIGSEEHTVFTALGDPVNVAARLQDMTKALSCEAILSEAVLKTANLPAGDLRRIEVPIRGRVEPMVIYTAEKAAMLSDLIADFAVAAA